MKAQLHIQNLKCGGCKATIINRLSVIKHISGVDLDLDNETVSFDYDTKIDLPLKIPWSGFSFLRFKT